MQEFDAGELLRKWRDGSLNDEERSVLESWYLSLAKEQQSAPGIDELQRFLASTQEPPVFEELNSRREGLVKRLYTYGAAASVILLCTFIYFLNPGRPDKTTPQHVATAAGDIMPGDNRAMLTLADGSQIRLDHAARGEIVKEGKMSVVKTGEGRITYQDNTQKETPASPGNTALSNTLTTPKAGNYQVTLSDGTNVWLNAASSIRFPTVFNSNERVIEVVGEVYLEVKKWKRDGRNVPFKVRAGSQVVEVLGTRFNINSYLDEGSIKTTLLEGSIKVNLDGSQNKGVLLKPGEQATLDLLRTSHPQKLQQPFEVSDVDPHSVVAWKDGYFHFNNIGLPELMRQIARWYDMEVEYEGVVKEYEFVGEIERGTRLSKVLTILESGGVNFRVEGRKIIVTK